MSNPRRSSIRIGSPLGGSNDTSETGRTDPPMSHHLSSFSRTPQSGTEQPLATRSEESNASPPPALTPPSGDSVTKPNAPKVPSGGERSDTSSHPPGQGSTPSTDVHVVPFSLPVPPSKVENFVPLSPPPASEGEVEDSLLGPEQFSTLNDYLKYIINQIDPDSASNKISELLKLKMVESPSSPVVCAPVVPSTPSTEVSEEGQRAPSTFSTEVPMKSSPPQQQAPLVVSAGNPNPTTPSQEVPVAGVPDISVPTTVALSEVHLTPSVPSSEVLHIPPTSGQTPQQGHVTSSAPAVWQVPSSQLSLTGCVQRIFAGDELNPFLNRCNSCPFPRFSPGYNASLDIYVSRDFRTGWWYAYTTNFQRLYLQDRRPDHCASYFGPELRRNRPLRDALMNVQENIGVTNSSSLLWVNIERTIEERDINESDPTQVRLAREVSELRSRENQNLPLDQRYGNPLHKWDRFKAAAQVDPRRIASCVTPECLAALRAQGRFSTMSDSISAINNINEEQIWESILHLSQYSTLETARNQLYRVQMNWNIQDFRNR
ncbi:hypothetical protein P9112_005289 [Eukaryota sp. TZLM1-RC]